MRMRAVVISLTLLLAVAYQVRPDDDPEPKADRSLIGVWQMTTRVQDGVPSDDDLIKNRTITFDKDKYTIHDRKQLTVQLSYKLNWSKKPAHIDCTFVTPNDGGTDVGIVKIQGDTLYLCLAQGGARPDKFESKQGDGRIFATYKRVKK